MNTSASLILFSSVALVVASLLLAPALRHRLAQSGRAFLRRYAITLALANDNPVSIGIHQGGQVTGYLTDAPVTQRYSLVTQGASGDNTYKVCTSIADIPAGVCTDEPAATTDPVNIQLLNSAGKTTRMVAAGVIAAGNLVVTNGDGKVKALPAVAGVYWGVGRAVTSATTSGDLVEVDPILQQVGVSFVT